MGWVFGAGRLCGDEGGGGKVAETGLFYFDFDFEGERVGGKLC